MRKLALVLAVVPLAAACTHKEAFEDARREIANQDAVIRELREANEALAARERELEARIKAADAEVAALRAGRGELDQDLQAFRQRLESFEEGFGRLGELEGVLLKPTADGVALEVADIVLFAPGKAELRSSGKKLLRDVVERIGAHEGPIRVEGHTDSQPVVVTAAQYPMGNLQLSGRRALVVANFLIEECGLPASRVSYAGYGEHRPVVPNTTDENMSRNRRVEIVLVSPKSGG